MFRRNIRGFMHPLRASPSASVLFSWKALWICQRHPIYVISQHLFLTKWHRGVNTSAPKNGICLFWTWKPCVRHHHITKKQLEIILLPFILRLLYFSLFFSLYIKQYQPLYIVCQYCHLLLPV